MKMCTSGNKLYLQKKQNDEQKKPSHEQAVDLWQRKRKIKSTHSEFWGSEIRRRVSRQKTSRQIGKYIDDLIQGEENEGIGSDDELYDE